jgi:hypothetical protein
MVGRIRAEEFLLGLMRFSAARIASDTPAITCGTFVSPETEESLHPFQLLESG